MTANNSLQKVSASENKLVGVTLDADLKELAHWAVQSGMFSDIKTVSQGGMKILAGRELGLPAVSSLSAFWFIKGRVVPSADLLASLIKRSRKYNYRILEHSDKICTLEFWEFFNGSWQKMGVPVSYTAEDAKREESSSKETYKKFTDDMYFAACMRKGVRRYCPDITKGGEFAVTAESEYVAAELAESVADLLPEQAPDEEPTDFSDAIEGELVAEEPATREATVNAICADLVKAGDSIKWSSEAEIVEYANTALDTKYRTLAGMSDEHFNKLCLDLNDRLGNLTAGEAF